MSALTRAHTPEERELARKQADIDRLSAQLADRELELATLRAELTAFQIRYLRAVGSASDVDIDPLTYFIINVL